MTCQCYVRSYYEKMDYGVILKLWNKAWTKQWTKHQLAGHTSWASDARSLNRRMMGQRIVGDWPLTARASYSCGRPVFYQVFMQWYVGARIIYWRWTNSCFILLKTVIALFTLRASEACPNTLVSWSLPRLHRWLAAIVRTSPCPSYTADSPFTSRWR